MRGAFVRAPCCRAANSCRILCGINQIQKLNKLRFKSRFHSVPDGRHSACVSEAGRLGPQAVRGEPEPSVSGRPSGVRVADTCRPSRLSPRRGGYLSGVFGAHSRGSVAGPLPPRLCGGAPQGPGASGARGQAAGQTPAAAVGPASPLHAGQNSQARGEGAIRPSESGSTSDKKEHPASPHTTPVNPLLLRRHRRPAALHPLRPFSFPSSARLKTKTISDGWRGEENLRLFLFESSRARPNCCLKKRQLFQRWRNVELEAAPRGQG